MMRNRLRTLLDRLVIHFASLLEWSPFEGQHFYSIDGELHRSASKPSEVDVPR